jgi:translation initiation factor 1
MADKNGGLVYSTAVGRVCPGCRRPIADCVCKQKRPDPAGDGVVRVFRESRNGKSVTVIKGLALPPIELAQLGKQLKVSCGSGGTVKGGVIEVQGEHCDRVLETLKLQGWKAKRSGG